MRIGLKQSAFASIALVAAVYLLTLVSIEERGFWTTDNANKFLQLQALVASDYADAAISWPGRGVDPDLTLNPLPAPFSHVESGKLHSQYPPFFAAVSFATISSVASSTSVSSFTAISFAVLVTFRL